MGKDKYQLKKVIVGTMLGKGIPIATGTAPDSFAQHFHDKVRINVAKTKVNINAVYNGKCLYKLIIHAACGTTNRKGMSPGRIRQLGVLLVFPLLFTYVNM